MNKRTYTYRMHVSSRSPEHLYQKAFNSSLQANIIFIVADGRIIAANRAACKLLRYSKKELLTRNRTDIFSVSESSYKKMHRQREAEGWVKADVSLITKSGSSLPCQVTSVIFQDESGISNSIMSIMDLREGMLKQKKIDVASRKVVAGDIVIAQSKSDDRQARSDSRQAKSDSRQAKSDDRQAKSDNRQAASDSRQAESDSRQAESDNWIRSVAKSSYDVIWDWDITIDLISFGKNYEKVFGIKLPKRRISFKEWMDFFLPEERQIIEGKLNKIFESEIASWQDTYKFTCSDGSVGQVISQANVIRDNEGKPIRMIGVIHDMSRIQKLEGIIGEEITMRKRQITEAKEMERSDLGKELHDNINQLLGASMLYLDMARKDLPNGEIYLIHSSEYTLTAIEEIRKLTRGLRGGIDNDLGLCGSIEHIIRDTMETCPVTIRYKPDYFMEEEMSENFQLDIFRIVQEQLNNILKHSKASEIDICISRMNAGLVLSIADNGMGFDTSKKGEGIGIRNIISRAASHKGKADFISEPGKGCTLVVTFPVMGDLTLPPPHQSLTPPPPHSSSSSPFCISRQ